jgi:dTDP-4-amino-4,6-dideoxygalactose transaminase
MSNPVVEFEKAFAVKIGSPYAIAVNSGTSALHAALVACQVKGGEVIMPALCPAMDAFAIIHAGATPVFADVDPKTGLITAETIKAVYNETKTRAIITVHLHGLPCDMDPIMQFADRKNAALWVIEDCAQSLLAKYKGKNAGTIGHFGCFSFEKKKHMTTGSEGGMIISNDATLAMRARKFAGIGYKHMTAEAGRTSLSAATYQRPDYERFDTIGLNYRMCEAQAEIGLWKLAFINDVIERRQTIGLMWQHALGVQCQPHDYDATNVFYSAAYDYKGDDWVGFYEQFCKQNGDGFYAMPKVPYQESALINYRKWWNLQGKEYGHECPIAEGLQKRLMLFKTHYKTIAHATRQVSILHDLIHVGA